MLRLFLLILGGLAVAAGAVFVISVGPRNVIGMLRYDTRREGKLEVGDRAPDITLVSLDGGKPVTLRSGKRDRPLVLVFGSFT
jgi:hypothetical protein